VDLKTGESFVLRLFPALASLFVLAGCSTLDLKRPVAKEDIVRIKKVGVASLLGDAVYGISMGITALGNENFSAPVPDWKMDAAAASHAVALLRRNGRFEVAPLDRSSYSAEQLMADNARLLWDLAASQGFDTLVILRPGVSENFQIFKPGYGIFERSFVGLSSRCLYAAYQVEVDEVATRKKIAWQWGGDEDTPCLADSEKRLDFKAKFDDYSEPEKQAMRDGIEARVSETLGTALHKLKLVSALDAAQ
jgi:hypothetical protein